jgi:hypothetical protein
MVALAGPLLPRNNDRKAIGEVIAVAGDEPDAGTIATGHDAEAVMLDFNPASAKTLTRLFGL